MARVVSPWSQSHSFSSHRSLKWLQGSVPPEPQLSLIKSVDSTPAAARSLKRKAQAIRRTQPTSASSSTTTTNSNYSSTTSNTSSRIPTSTPLPRVITRFPPRAKWARRREAAPRRWLGRLLFSHLVSTYRVCSPWLGAVEGHRLDRVPESMHRISRKSWASTL